MGGEEGKGGRGEIGALPGMVTHSIRAGTGTGAFVAVPAHPSMGHSPAPHATAVVPPIQPPSPCPRQLHDPTWIKYILPKGFVSVDGSSLTVGEVTKTTFSVYLIPETLRSAGEQISGGWDERHPRRAGLQS